MSRQEPVTRRVIKLGGSLLVIDDLAERLRNWISREPAAATLLVVGGGELVDRIRAADQTIGFSATEAHWLSVAAMTLNARSVAARLGVSFVSPEEAAGQLSKPTLAVLDAWTFLWEIDGRDQSSSFKTACGERDSPILLGGTRIIETVPSGLEASSSAALPASWDVTSDSIAARVAHWWQADELVLGKSCLPALPLTLDGLTRQGYVDEYFAQAAARLPGVYCVNFAVEPAAELKLELPGRAEN